MKTWFHPRIWLPVASPLAVLAIWYATTAAHIFPADILVSPAAVISAFGELIQSGDLVRHLRESLFRLALGFSTGASAGLVFGTMMALSKTLRDLFSPLFQVLRQVPVLAFIPLLILFLGIGETFKIIVIAVAAFFPAALGSFDGVNGISQGWFEVGRLYRLPLPVLVARVLIPAAAPAVLASVRLSLTRSWLVLVAAELIAADDGIGQMMEMGRQMFRLDIVMAGIITAGVIGFTLDRVFVLVQNRLLHWRQVQGA